MARPISRRDAIRAGLATLAVPPSLGMTPPPPRQVRAFRLVEPAGFRRFGYPIHAIVPGAGDGRNFRLVRDGRAIPAQFRPVPGPGGRLDVALDFIANLGPLETARHEVQFGLGVEPGPEPSGGLKVEQVDGSYRVSQGGAPTFEIPGDLAGFLRSAGSPRLGYVRRGGGGLIARSRGRSLPIAASEHGVTREGPMAVGLRFVRPGVFGSTMTVDLTIPHSKSWVQAVATLGDPEGNCSGIDLELDLIVEGSPTLVDFGAGSAVYGQVQGPSPIRMEMLAGKVFGGGWVVRQGEGDEPAVIAASTPGSPRPAEGWAHVMDSRRCTALAVADFGRSVARDRITVHAAGRLRLARDFAVGDSDPPKGPKTLAFWLHFVPMPVQVGAATSPQSILAPPLVEWDRAPG